MVDSETSTYVFVFVTLHFEGKPNHKTWSRALSSAWIIWVNSTYPN